MIFKAKKQKCPPYLVGCLAPTFVQNRRLPEKFYCGVFNILSRSNYDPEGCIKGLTTALKSSELSAFPKIKSNNNVLLFSTQAYYTLLPIRYETFA